jgi:hypothetical protein
MADNNFTLLARIDQRLEVPLPRITRSSSFDSESVNVLSPSPTAPFSQTRAIRRSSRGNYELTPKTMSNATSTEALGLSPELQCSDNEEDTTRELLLDPALNLKFEEIRLKYADMLYRWRLYYKCTEVLKYCVTDLGIEPITGIAGTVYLFTEL